MSPPIPAAEPPLAGTGLTPEQMRVLARRPAQCLRHGMIGALPFLLVLIPFGLLFGVVSTEAELNLPQVMGFAVLVLAGASQFTAVQLLAEHTPAVIVIVSALAVNLRMAMYSASMVPWLGQAAPRAKGLVAYMLIDQTFVVALQHYEANPRLRMDQRLAYFLGAGLLCFLSWVGACFAGFTLGRAIPESWALDFALPITFLAMVAPMLRTPAHLAAAAVSIIGALALSGLPSGMGLLLSAPLAMATGVWVEARLERRKGGL